MNAGTTASARREGNEDIILHLLPLMQSGNDESDNIQSVHLLLTYPNILPWRW